MEVASHLQSTQSTSIAMQNIQIFYGGLNHVHLLVQFLSQSYNNIYDTGGTGYLQIRERQNELR